ncbi:MAG: Gfo/Idh/MocA family protein, partial [Planctomycetaceae bacterium]
MVEGSRRDFLQAAAVASLASTSSHATATGVDDRKLKLGLIGCGGMGSGHLRELSRRTDAEVAWVCDVDSQRLAAAAKIVEEGSGKAPQTTPDLRQILDDATVDAVFIATPDHWHTPAAILALDAGKHVYVEKPCCHNIREGRLLADAVKRSGKKLQVGTQSRSTEMVRAGIQRLKNGDIGEVLV